MLNLDEDIYEDNTEFINFESFERQRPPFLPIPDGNLPPTHNYPPGFNYPSEENIGPHPFNYPEEGFNPPAFNFPGGDFTPPGAPKSPPPNYIPSKKEQGVQNINQGQYTPGTKAVSPNSIRFCVFKYTYIWEKNGRSYWAFLFNVDRRSVSGFRWTGRNWIYFGVDLRRIDSFVCYRSTFEDYYDNYETLI